MSITSVERRVNAARLRIAAESRLAVEVLVGWRAALGLAEPWSRLEDDVPDGLPCQSWDALVTLHQLHLADAGSSPRHREPGRTGTDREARVRPVIVLLRADGRPVGLWPLQLETAWGTCCLRALGHGLLSRHAPLMTSEAPRGIEPIDLLSSLLPRVGPRVRVDLAGLSRQTAGGDWVVDGLDRRGPWVRRTGPVEVRLDLQGGWARVAASLTQRFRRRASAADRRLRRPPGEFRVLRLFAEGTDEVATLLDAPNLPGPRPAPGGLLRELCRRAAEAGRLSAWLALDPGGLRAGSLVWHGPRRAVELWADAEPGPVGRDALDVLRWDQLHALTADERCDHLTLAPGQGSELVAVPDHQSELTGALGSPLFRAVARWLPLPS
jgi:hypothetical protein